MAPPALRRPAPPANTYELASWPATRLRRAYALAALLAVATLFALGIDIPTARFFLWMQERGPGDLRKAVALFETFAHTAGVLVIVLVIVVLDPQHRRSALRVAVSALGSGLLADVAKLLIGRTRPNEFWLTGFPDAAGNTFQGWIPVLQSESWSEGLRRGVQSFPSGHSAVAAGLAIGLTWLYPRGRWLFAALAALAMLQRLESGAHFPSDTLAGASIGVLFGTLCCDARWLGGIFDRWERRAKQPLV